MSIDLTELKAVTATLNSTVSRLMEQVGAKPFCETCGDSGFTGTRDYDGICDDCAGQSVHAANAREQVSPVSGGGGGDERPEGLVCYCCGLADCEAVEHFLGVARGPDELTSLRSALSQMQAERQRARDLLEKEGGGIVSDLPSGLEFGILSLAGDRDEQKSARESAERLNEKFHELVARLIRERNEWAKPSSPREERCACGQTHLNPGWDNLTSFGRIHSRDKCDPAASFGHETCHQQIGELRRDLRMAEDSEGALHATVQELRAKLLSVSESKPREEAEKYECPSHQMIGFQSDCAACVAKNPAESKPSEGAELEESTFGSPVLDRILTPLLPSEPSEGGER